MTTDSHKYSALESLVDKGITFPQDSNQVPAVYSSAQPLTFSNKTTNSDEDCQTVESKFTNDSSKLEDDDDRYVFFFDIDNCLYPKSSRIHHLMADYIHSYFVRHLSLDDESAELLHKQYYKDYGLALEGLVRFHQIDALEYNTEVDDALPLERILHPDPALRLLLEAIDKTKVKKLWLFTNAYKNHGHRVVKLLGIDDLFDGMTFCDYSKSPLICKPKHEMFDKAMDEAGVPSYRKDRCLYIDDSYINVESAVAYGWTSGSVQYIDPEDPLPEKPAGTHLVRSVFDLPLLFPQIFDQQRLKELLPVMAQPALGAELPLELLMKMAHNGKPVLRAGLSSGSIVGASDAPRCLSVNEAGLGSEAGTLTPTNKIREPSTHKEKRQQEMYKFSTRLLDLKKADLRR